MAEVKSSWFLPSHDGSSTDNISIPDERIRLFNVWFTPRGVVGTGDLDLTLRTGSISGDILMSLKIYNQIYLFQVAVFYLKMGSI